MHKITLIKNFHIKQEEIYGYVKYKVIPHKVSYSIESYTTGGLLIKVKSGYSEVIDFDIIKEFIKKEYIKMDSILKD